jgi:PAS domain S-box-containing protein
LAPLKKNRIAYRLTFQVILFSTVVALLLTVLQLYLDYRRDLSDIYTFFTTIEATSIRPLEESVWILDDLQVNLQLEGLIKRQDIVYAAVEMGDQIAWTKGAPTFANSLSRIFPLYHQIRGVPEQIGRLRVTASLDGIYQRLLRRIIILLSSNAVKTFLVSGFILLLFQRNITKHLTTLAEYFKDIDIRNSKPHPLQLGRRPSHQPDELDQVTATLNALCQSGYRAFLDLRTQEQHLRLFFDATEESIVGVDRQGACTFINRAGQDHFLGTTPDSFIGSPILERFAHDCRDLPQPDMLGEQVRTTIREKRVLLTDEMPLRRPDGSLLLISLRSYPVLEHKQCTGAIVFFADISRQQKLEQEKQLFTKIIRQAPALILIVDSNSRIEYVNASFETVTGYESGTLVGKNVLEAFRGLHLEQQIEEVSKLINKGETWIGTFTRTNHQGRCINLEAVIFPIFNREGQRTNVVAMGRDITRELQLVEQLHHAQKMEAIGKLVASIAHEFGNPLLGVRFALREVLQHHGIPLEDKNLLRLAENECDRMRKLIRDLQQFNRPSIGKKTDFDLHRILEETLILHQNLLTKKQISLIRKYDPQPIRLSAVEDQIRQVFINLLINAGDAIGPTGGILTISTVLRNEEVLVTVGDNGPGIQPENLDHIFEPFFTTKSAVEGTGLGLPVSYGIVRAHGGSIEVQSKPGKTEFTVRLPQENVSAPILQKAGVAS